MSLSVMVTANGLTANNATRVSLHMFEFESEEQFDAWLATAPVKEQKFDGPDIHVEIPKMNSRRKD